MNEVTNNVNDEVATEVTSLIMEDSCSICSKMGLIGKGLLIIGVLGGVTFITFKVIKKVKERKRNKVQVAEESQKD